MADDNAEIPFSFEEALGGDRDEWVLSEEHAYQIVLGAHPDLKAALERDVLPERIPGPNGQPINPRLHLAMHVIVERQLAANLPDGIAEIAERLERKEVPNHEIRHLIGEVLAVRMFEVLKENKSFDAKAYLEQLRETAERVQEDRP